MNDVCYAIAVSVLSSPAMNRIWEDASLYQAREIYERVTFRGGNKTQDYLTARYSNHALEAAQAIQEVADKAGISIITFWDEQYPVLLREINRPPLVLYTRGNFSFTGALAVVGTRKADSRSRHMAREIVRCIVQKGFSVVSGMAIGLDREAHAAALDCHGTTIGVLANGIDVIYPRSNHDLYKRILASEGSGLVSEYPPGIYTQKWTFTRRNRIISGLSRGTVVIKAAERSGALITARYALEQNRDIFACTGYSFDPEYAGCHRLIQEGAYCIGQKNDFMKDFCSAGSESRGSAGFFFNTLSFKNSHCESRDFGRETSGLQEDGSETGDRILAFLAAGECTIDALVVNTGYSINVINETLSLLELSGKIIRRGNHVIRI